MSLLMHLSPTFRPSGSRKSEVNTLEINEKIRVIASALRDSSIEAPYREAELILQKVLSLPRHGLYTTSFSLTTEQAQRIDNLVAKRKQGRPLQYLLGETDFFDMTIVVGEGVLIPRPETEHMVECAVNHIRERGLDRAVDFSILDLCTGSGCVALALGRFFPEAFVIGTDISPSALRYAIKNAQLNDITNVSFAVADIFSPIKEFPFHLIISNPPYVKTSEIRGLQREVRDYEPIEAIDGGEDGFDFYRRIFDNIMAFLHDEGSLILELGYGQSGAVINMAKEAGFSNCTILKDYADIDRVLIVRR